MDLNAAAIFVKVVETGGFSAAGRALGVPKATVSKKVGDLENALGSRLLNRTTRRLSLTEVGEGVYGHFAAALDSFSAAERAAQAAQRAPVGMLTIGSPSAVSGPFLLPAILAFMQAYSQIDVTHMSLDSPSPAEEERIDVLLTVGAEGGGDARDRKIAIVDVGLFACAGYLERMGAPSEPMGLVTHAPLAPTQAIVGDQRFVWRLERDGGAVAIETDQRPRLRSNDPSALASATLAGWGVALLSLRMVEAHPQSAAFIRVLPEWRVPGIALYARRRDGAGGSLKNRLFIEFVADWFRSH